MQKKREKQKIELVEKLKNICSLLPNHTVKGPKGEIFIKSCKCFKENHKFISISDIQNYSFHKIEQCVKEKQKILNIGGLVKGIGDLISR